MKHELFKIIPLEWNINPAEQWEVIDFLSGGKVVRSVSICSTRLGRIIVFGYEDIKITKWYQIRTTQIKWASLMYGDNLEKQLADIAAGKGDVVCQSCEADGEDLVIHWLIEKEARVDIPQQVVSKTLSEKMSEE